MDNKIELFYIIRILMFDIVTETFNVQKYASFNHTYYEVKYLVWLSGFRMFMKPLHFECSLAGDISFRLVCSLGVKRRGWQSYEA